MNANYLRPHVVYAYLLYGNGTHSGERNREREKGGGGRDRERDDNFSVLISCRKRVREEKEACKVRSDG